MEKILLSSLFHKNHNKNYIILIERRGERSLEGEYRGEKRGEQGRKWEKIGKKRENGRKVEKRGEKWRKGGKRGEKGRRRLWKTSCCTDSVEGGVKGVGFSKSLINWNMLFLILNLAEPAERLDLGLRNHENNFKLIFHPVFSGSTILVSAPQILHIFIF